MVIAATYYGASAFIAAQRWYWGLAMLAAPFLIFSLLDLNASRKGKPAAIVAAAAGALVLLCSTYGMAAGAAAPAAAAPIPAETQAPSARNPETVIPVRILPLLAGSSESAHASPSPDRTAVTPAPTAAPTEDLQEYAYVASKNSKVFHRPDCASAKTIKPENLIKFRTREDALATGRRPCKNCKP